MILQRKRGRPKKNLSSAVTVSHAEKQRIKSIAEEDPDFDYDFTLYDDAEETRPEDINEDIANTPEPAFKGVRARYSNWSSELDRLAQINALVTKYAIIVESRTQDINILWKFYGVMNEMWESMKPLYGYCTQNTVRDIKKRCCELLEADYDMIPHKVHNNLLYYRSVLYRFRQFSNLGYDVERRSRGYTDRAKKTIVQ